MQYKRRERAAAKSLAAVGIATGLVLGLASAGRRFSRGVLYGSATMYAILLLALVGPFLGLIYPVPGAQYLLLLTPLLALVAPALAYAGTRRPPATITPA